MQLGRGLESPERALGLRGDGNRLLNVDHCGREEEEEEGKDEESLGAARAINKRSHACIRYKLYTRRTLCKVPPWPQDSGMIMTSPAVCTHVTFVVCVCACMYVCMFDVNVNFFYCP
jgi:hypothetical protein